MISYDPADNRFRIRPALLPLVDAFKRRHRLPTRTEALNQMVLRAEDVERQDKPHTTGHLR